MLNSIKRLLSGLTGATPADTAAPKLAQVTPSAGQAAAAERSRGNALLNNGMLEEAATCYQNAVDLDPLSADSWVNLGFALRELGRPGSAREALLHAVEVDRLLFDAHFILGLIAREGGDPAGAIGYFRRALELEPTSLPARTELCVAAFEGRQLDLAWETVRAGIRQDPGVSEFHYLAGNLLSHERAHAQAVTSYERALAIEPNQPTALHNLGLALTALGRIDEAIATLRQALTIDNAYGQAHSSLAAALIAQGRPDEAILSARHALSLNPADVEALNNLGNAQLAKGQVAQSIESYQMALAVQPGHADALGNMGLALHTLGRLDEAASCFQRVLAIDPQRALTHNNLGNTLQRQNKLEAAVSSYRRALAIDPHLANVHSNIAGAWQAQGEHSLAIASWREALRLKPDYFEAWSNLLYSLNFLPGSTPAQYLLEARRFGDAVAAAARPWRSWPESSRTPERRLRVGFVSGDLRAHSVGLFLESIISHLDYSRIELLAYSTQPLEDELTARIKPAFASWKLLVGHNDEVCANMIRQDGVDVLLDLAGHTAHNRLPVFAWRPAPVQVSWLGYFSSTGVPSMNFVLADEVGVPQAHQGQFVERISYLPDTRLCFTAPGFDDILPGPLPALSDAGVTFGCFQNMIKLNDDVLDLWGVLFEAMPRARVHIQCKQLSDLAVRRELLARLGRVGIASSRVTLTGSLGRREFLLAHRGVDIMLDTFPGTGGTTTCEALWMGVPTMTLSGETMLARQGASILCCVGLGDWVARTPEEYVSRLVDHCRDPVQLALLRSGLRERVLISPLFDSRLFAARFQQALEGMRQSTLNGQGL